MIEGRIENTVEDGMLGDARITYTLTVDYKDENGVVQHQVVANEDPYSHILLACARPKGDDTEDLDLSIITVGDMVDDYKLVAATLAHSLEDGPEGVALALMELMVSEATSKPIAVAIMQAVTAFQGGSNEPPDNPE